MEPSVTTVAASVVKFLRSPKASEGLTEDAAEGLEVAAQCLEAAYGLTQDSDPRRPPPPDLLEVFRRHSASGPVPPAGTAFVTATAAGPFVVPGFTMPQAQAQAQQPPQPPQPAVSPEVKAEAEALKNEGNTLMKSTMFAEALQKYTEAIALDSTNPIFFCNRAAAHSSLKNNEAAIEDCRRALALNPKYGRAYGRLGLALTNLNRHREAREAYRIACQLEPDNEAYRNNLAVTEETLAPDLPPMVDIGSLLHNPTLANVATHMLSDPGLQNIMGRLLGDLSSSESAGGAAAGAPGAGAGSGNSLNILLQAGQQLAQQMQQANPELVEQLRQHLTNQPPSQQPPSNPPSKPPPQ